MRVWWEGVEAMASYDLKLFKEAAKGPLTAKQIGEIMGCYSADALTRLRARRSVRVTVVAEFSRFRGPRKLYKIEKVQPVNGAYCCGYCERQRAEGRTRISSSPVSRQAGA